MAYGFVSPGALGGNAIAEFLTQREALERQRMLDELQRQQQAEQGRRADAQLTLQQQQMEQDRLRAAADQEFRTNQAAAAEKDRAFGRGVDLVENTVEGDEFDPETAKFLTEQGLGYAVRRTPGVVQQGAQVGTMGDDIPLYDVSQSPDTFTSRGGSRYLNARAAEDARLAQAQFEAAERERRAAEERAFRAEQAERERQLRAEIAAGNLAAREELRRLMEARTRPMTSMDAGRISDLENALNDLDGLRSSLTELPQATGTSARVGAMLPNVVTEITGWGADAKSRQAVIDRVKQVIGKTLEGGVLRKEDEAKYAKILPTIGDEASVAQSKLDGLERAIQQQRETFVESLGNAGFNVSNFTRPSQPRQAAPKPAPKPRRYDVNGNPL